MQQCSAAPFSVCILSEFGYFYYQNIGCRLENVVYIELLRRCAYDFRDVEIDGKTIHIISAIEWLLS